MCGLTGVLGPGIIKNDLEAIRDLAWVSALRGTDSTGVFQVNMPWSNNQEPTILLEKDSSDVSYFLWYHENHKDGNREVISSVRDDVVAFHLRAATRGSLTKENAHPFDTGRYVSMHNGTLWDKRFDHKTKTDSEMMFSFMETEGVEGVLSKLEERSAYAIVMFDKEQKQMVFARNELRTLFFCAVEDRNVLYWASEDWMLRGVLKRRGIKIKDNAIFHLNPNLVYRLSPSDFNSKENAHFKTTLIEAKPKEKEPKRGNKNHNRHFRNYPGLPVGRNNKGGSNVVIFPPSPAKSLVPLPKNKIPKAFCVSCNKELSLTKRYLQSKCFGDDTFVCNICEDSPFSINQVV